EKINPNPGEASTNNKPGEASVVSQSHSEVDGGVVSTGQPSAVPRERRRDTFSERDRDQTSTPSYHKRPSVTLTTSDGKNILLSNQQSVRRLVKTNSNSTSDIRQDTRNAIGDTELVSEDHVNEPTNRTRGAEEEEDDDHEEEDEEQDEKEKEREREREREREQEREREREREREQEEQYNQDLEADEMPEIDVLNVVCAREPVIDYERSRSGSQSETNTDDIKQSNVTNIPNAFSMRRNVSNNNSIYPRYKRFSQEINVHDRFLGNLRNLNNNSTECILNLKRLFSDENISKFSNEELDECLCFLVTVQNVIIEEKLQRNCVVCYNADNFRRKVIFMPCRHQTVCVHCYKKKKVGTRCPTCDIPIDHTIVPLPDDPQ
ncbi:hypothetical protein RFI_11939, partial [Reticulomyxa filosa]